jgi:energy-coupling factor transport system substrate-specific component
MDMKKLTAFLICLTLVLLLAPTAQAAGNESLHVNYITDVFNEETGLPTGEANAIVQAHNGYLWIGSYGGLIRFDGSTFVSFTDRLASGSIRALYESGDGTLFIGTNDAGAYRFKDDVFTPLRSEDSHTLLCVRDFAEDSSGRVYAASTTGVARVEGDTLAPFLYPELEGEHFLSIIADRGDRLWALSDSGNICVFNDAGYIATVTEGALFSQGNNYALACSRLGELYVGSSVGELVKLSDGPHTVPGDVGSYRRTDYDVGDIGSINRIKPLSDGTVMISALNGFGYLDASGVFRRIDKPADKNLSANWAETDHEGNRWVASSNYGVIRYSVGCFDSCNYNSNLGDYTINAVAKAGDRFYLGTDSGLLLFDDDWNQLDAPITETMQGIRIRNVTVDDRGRVWMATYSAHGAACYDPATGELTDFGEAQGILSEKIRVVCPLSGGRMLVGSQLGINIIENGAVTGTWSGDDGMENTSVLCAMELNGRVYAGTDGSGIYEITENGLKNLGFAEGLSQGVVLRMAPDADGNGNFFVCAGDKLFYYELEAGSFRSLSGMECGAGSIYSAYDRNGRIFLLQDGGVYAADKAGVLNGLETYTAQYGVKCGLTGTLSANTWNWLDSDGALYMPTRSGVSKFYFSAPASSCRAPS